MVPRHFVAAAALAIAISMCGGTLAQEDSLVFHDLSKSEVFRRPSITYRAVVTDAGSIIVGDLIPNYKQPPHHHEQEQIMLGTAPPIEFWIGDVRHILNPFTAAIPPSNVEHHMMNPSDTPAHVIEFQPIARTDWLPPFTPLPVLAPAVSVPEEVPLTADLSLMSAGWKPGPNGSRMKPFAGKTIGVELWDLSKRGAAAPLKGHARVHRFAYVLEGQISVASGRTIRSAGAQMFIAIAPSAEDVTLTSNSGAKSLVAVYESIR
jgi:hypothetical protein